jgi:hypothetical protein
MLDFTDMFVTQATAAPPSRLDKENSSRFGNIGAAGKRLHDGRAVFDKLSTADGSSELSADVECDLGRSEHDSYTQNVEVRHIVYYELYGQ